MISLFFVTPRQTNMTEERLQEPTRPQPWAQEEYESLRSAPKKDFDELTFITAQVCQTPIAAISFCGKEESWVHSVSGISEDLLPFPGLLRPDVTSGKILFHEDLTSEYYLEIPMLENFAFYAGVPLVNSKNHVLGMLFVLDNDPKVLTEDQQQGLKILGQQLIKLLDYRKQHTELRNVQLKLRQKYSELEKFASVVSHDIKSPLANIISLTEFLKEENQDNMSEETRQYLDFLMQSSYSLRNYVDGILTFYRSDNILEKKEEDVDLHKLLKGIAHLYRVNSEVEITYPTSGILKNVNKAALSQIFMNLISNGLKYNNKDLRQIEIGFKEEEEYYSFEVKDNGNGIRRKDFDKIFDLFATLDSNDRDGHPGSGIGLATVKKMLDHMEGSIELESELGEGTNFKFRIKRK